jgi:DNA-binding transcriptional ArsR family regulator
MTDQDTAAVGKVMSHPLRLRIVAELNKRGPLSPNGLSKLLDQPLGSVSYHVKALLEAGVLKLVRTEPRRGALEHFYALEGRNTKLLLAMLEVAS